MDPRVVATAVCYLLVLGPAAVSAWARNRREARDRRPMQRLLDMEAAGFSRPRRTRRYRELVGCLVFATVVLGLLATPLLWDGIPLPP